MEELMYNISDLQTIDKVKANLKPIRTKYAYEMSLVGNIFHEQFLSSDLKIQQVSEWLKDSPGKLFRPLLALLSANAFGNINEEVRYFAAAIELIHNASLIHDDILDEAPFRRGKETPHQIWGVKNAILLGDYLFSCGYRLVLKTSDKECQDDLPRVAAKMCESELLQSDNQFNTAAQLQKYYQIIDGKTSGLFGVSASVGCRLAGGSALQKKIMNQCGNLAGRAFQIMDDYLDFAKSGEEDNKPRGADISAGIFTLPIILMLEKSNSKEKIILEEILLSQRTTGLNHPTIAELNNKYKISQEVYRIACDFVREAEKLLDEAKPTKETKDIKLFLNSIIVE